VNPAAVVAQTVAVLQAVNQAQAQAVFLVHHNHLPVHPVQTAIHLHPQVLLLVVRHKLKY
jgi:hypothetical protein